MRLRCARRTQFTDVTLMVPNRLQSLPSHPVARRQRGKREDLLQCFDFLFSDHHHPVRLTSAFR
jgi:hypothetical protein